MLHDRGQIKFRQLNETFVEGHRASLFIVQELTCHTLRHSTILTSFCKCHDGATFNSAILLPSAHVYAPTPSHQQLPKGPLLSGHSLQGFA